MSLFPYRKALALTAVVALVAAAGCDDKFPFELDSVEDISVIQLDTDADLVEIQVANGVITGEPINVPTNGETGLVALFFNSNDAELDAIDPDLFEIQVIPEDPSVIFTRTGPFTGILSGEFDDVTNLSVCIFGINEGSCRVGPFSVQAVVD